MKATAELRMNVCAVVSKRPAEQSLRPAQADPALRGMGTTGVALLFDPGGAVWLAWVGDSRAYRFRKGLLEELSEDHSLVANLIRQRKITQEEAKTHPRRSELSRALGPEPGVEVDLRSYLIEPGDTYLLCSDGLCGYLSSADISAIVGFEAPENAARQLVDLVNSEYNSPDNVTVQIIAVPSDEAVSVSTSSGVNGKGSVAEEHASDQLENHRSDSRAPGNSQSSKMVAIGTAALIVSILLVGAIWYGAYEKRAEMAAIARAEAEYKIEVERERERVRVEAELAAELAAALSAQAAKLEATAALEETARIDAARSAVLAREEAAARKATLAREEADARQVAAEQKAAERTKVLAEQERRRQQAITFDSSGTIQTAFNMGSAVEAFIIHWSRALNQGDYALYQELGFTESEDEFGQLYGNAGALHEITVLEKQQWMGGTVTLHVTETYDPPGDGPGFDSQTIERRLVLRKTRMGLRAAGDGK